MRLRLTTPVLLYSAVAAVAVAATAILALDVRASAPQTAAAPLTPALAVLVERPQRQEMASRLSAGGSVAAWQEASVGSEVNGLRLVQVHVNVGDIVERGQVLASFAADTVQAELAQIQANVAEAQAQAKEAAANAERAQSLAASGALSAQQIQQYATAEHTALARLEAQRAALQVLQLRLARTQVLAPDRGVISARSATTGAVVPAGQELFRLIRGGRLEWRAEVTPEEAVRLSADTAVALLAADGSRVAGRLRMVGPTVDAHTRTTLVYVDLPQSKGLKAGMFARGEFELSRSSALTVPQQAVVVRDGFSYVFKLEDNNRVTQQKVQTGRRLGERVEITEGISPDALLVASGAGFLNDSDIVKVIQP